MRRRRIWVTSALLLVSALAVELLVLADRAQILDRPVPSSLRTLRRELFPPPMTAVSRVPPLGPAAVDGVFTALFSRDAIALFGTDEPTRSELAAMLVNALREQSGEESRTADDLTERVEQMKAKPGLRKSPTLQELRWRLRSSSLLAEMLSARAEGLGSGKETLPGDVDLERLTALRRDMLVERFYAEVDPLIGVYEQGQAGNPAGSRSGAVEMLLAQEARRLVAQRGLTGREAALAEQALLGKMQMLLAIRPRLSPEQWRKRVAEAALDVTRGGGSATLVEKRSLIKGRLVVPQWTLRDAETDMTFHMDSESRIEGNINGLHVRPDGARARVSGRFTGRMDDRGGITGSGTYQVEATAGDISSLEQGRFELSGYPTRSGLYMGSLTLEPTSPSEAQPRTLLWEEPGEKKR